MHDIRDGLVRERLLPTEPRHPEEVLAQDRERTQHPHRKVEAHLPQRLVEGRVIALAKREDARYFL